jgi:DUF917 family protein
VATAPGRAAGPPLIRPTDVDALVLGVSLLGSGGGGDAATFAGVLRQRLGSGQIALERPAERPETWVVPVGVIGATHVLTEKLRIGREFRDAVAAVTRWTGRTPTALMALEAAGLNGLSALVAALDLGLPFVDADLMGRALPRLDQFTWAVRGLPIAPCALVEPSGQVLVVDNVDAPGLERTARAFLSATGGWAAIVLPPTELHRAAPHSAIGSLARALALGRAHSALPKPAEPAEVAAALGGRLLATGRVLEIARHSHGHGFGHSHGHSFGRGSISIIDSGRTSGLGAVVRLEAENEFFLALSDEEPIASCPDLLCLLDRRTAAPRTADTIRIGEEVMALVLPGPPWWRRGDVIGHVAPHAFGLDAPAVLLPEAAGGAR